VTAVHCATTLQGSNTPAKIAHRLGLSEMLVIQTLRHLAEIGMVAENRGGGFSPLRSAIHVRKGTPLAWNHLSGWRQKALEDASAPEGGLFHFSGLYSLSRQDLEKVQDFLHDLVGRTNAVVAESAEETM